MGCNPGCSGGRGAQAGREPVSKSGADAAARRHEAGFSVVEGLIASVILLIVVLGVLPLVSQSMVNNAQGNASTQEANSTVEKIEELLSLPFDNAELEVAGGATSAVSNAYKLIDDSTWRDGVYGGAITPQYRRTTTVEYFSVTDLQNDGDYTLDTPLDGSTLPGSIAFKRIQVQIQSQRVFTNSAYRVTTIQAY